MGIIIGYANIRDNGVLTIPKKCRDIMKVQDNDILIFVLQQNNVILIKGNKEISI